MARKKVAEILSVDTGEQKQFRFVLKSGNGEIIAQSWGESYTSKAMLRKTLRRHFAEFTVADNTKDGGNDE